MLLDTKYHDDFERSALAEYPLHAPDIGALKGTNLCTKHSNKNFKKFA